MCASTAGCWGCRTYWNSAAHFKNHFWPAPLSLSAARRLHYSRSLALCCSSIVAASSWLAAGRLCLLCCLCCAPRTMPIYTHLPSKEKEKEQAEREKPAEKQKQKKKRESTRHTNSSAEAETRRMLFRLRMHENSIRISDLGTKNRRARAARGLHLIIHRASHARGSSLRDSRRTWPLAGRHVACT
jgi:hypothetical protein